MGKKTATEVDQILSVFGSYAREDEEKALEELGKRWAFPDLEKKDVVRILRRNGIRSYGSLFNTKGSTTKENTPNLSKFEGLVKVCKKGPVPFEEICNKLNLSPQAAKALVQQALAAGLNIRIENDHIGLNREGFSEHTREVSTIPSSYISPVEGNLKKVGVISDTHLGSKYCMREQLIDFITYAYAQGVRIILHVGDILDGIYRHGTFEVSHTGIEDQVMDLYETLPQLPGLEYHGITGNHDFTFTEKIGINVGKYIESFFKQRGRNDFFTHGDRGAFLEVEGAVFHLWHPCRGVGHCKSYPLEKQCARYTSVKPQILLAGHWHIYNHNEERGIEAIACPTFQGGGSAFGKSLGGSPAIGGLILSWTQTEMKAIRDFKVEKRTYYEVEKPVVIQNAIDAIPVEPKRRKKLKMLVQVNPDPSIVGEYGVDPVIIEVRDFNSKTARDFAKQVSLAHNTGQPFIPIWIDSYGGDVYALMSMIDVIKTSKIPVITVVTGKAMSCGAILFTFGEMRFMGENATLMLHDAANLGKGYEKTFEAVSSTNELVRLNEIGWRMMEKNIKKPKGFLSKKAHQNGRADFYISSSQAKEWGLATHLGIPRWNINIKVSHELIAE